MRYIEVDGEVQYLDDCCYDCPFFDSDYYYCQHPKFIKSRADYEIEWEVPWHFLKDCPLREVKE